MPVRSHDQSKGFAFITALQHVTKELVKLNGVEFQGNCIVIEGAKSRLMFNPTFIVVKTLSATLQKMKIPSQ